MRKLWGALAAIVLLTVAFPALAQQFVFPPGYNPNASTAPSLPSRALIPAGKIGATTVIVGGYRTQGDNGAGAIYSSNGCTSSDLQAIADASGVYYCLVVNGPAIPGQFGAYGDAAFSFGHGTITTGPCVLNYFGINGTARPGDNLIGDGVTGNPTITALLTGSETGPSATFSLSSCSSNPAPSFTGSLAPNGADATGLTSILTFSGLTGTLAVNQTISGTNVAQNTQLISQQDSTHWIVSQNQTVSSEAMTTILHMQTYGGHDDCAALNAAAATGNDLFPEGPIANNGAQISYYGTNCGVVLNTDRQKINMSSARFLALPGFVGDYVITLAGQRQTATRPFVDGGAMIGAKFVGGIQCAGVNDIIDSPEMYHYSTIGVDLSNACLVTGAKELQQWNNLEPQLNQWSLTAIGEYWNHADSQDTGGFSFWNHTNMYFDCPSHTELIITQHPYNGNPASGNGGGPFLDPEQMHFAGCAGGPDLIEGYYDDDGQTNNFGVPLSIRNGWEGYSPTLSTYSNSCYINQYADGGGGQTKSDYRMWLPGALTGGLTAMCHNPNPNLATWTSAVGDGTHITLTLAASPAVQSVGVLATGGTVRYRVAWWPAGHPLVGDTITVAGFGNSAYNGTYTVTIANPFYVTVTSSATGAPGTLGTVQPTSAWTADNPMPVAGTPSAGFINVTGTPSVGPVKVTAVTANSISFASGATTGFVPGTVQEAWSGDWSGWPALQPNFYNGAVEGGDFLHSCTVTNWACGQYYAPSADTTGGIGFTYQIGASSGPYTVSYTNSGINEGVMAPSNSTHCFGMEANPFCIVEDGTGDGFLRTGGSNRWELNAGGVLFPVIDGGVAPNSSNIGNGTNRVNTIWAFIDNYTPETLAQLNTQDPSPHDGATAYITDAVACASAVVGSGSVHCPVYYDGSSSAWKAYTSGGSVNVMAAPFNAVGDCSTDDGPAIRAAMASLSAHGGKVLFPNPPGGCYLVNTTLTMSSTVPLWLAGSGRDSTTIRAGAAISGGVITFPVAFLQGSQITDMTIDGAGLASEAINAPQTVRTIFSHLIVENGTVADMVAGNGSSNSQENVWEDVKLDNTFTTTLANLPAYGLEMNDVINSDLVNVISANVKTANIYAHNGSNNYMVSVHGYDCFGACNQGPTYNFEITDFADTITGCEGDGSSTADVELAGFSDVLQGCGLGFDGVTPQIAVQFANGTSGNMVSNSIISNVSVLANSVVQAGSAGSGGNSAEFNFNVPNGLFAPNLTAGVATVTCSGTPTSSFASNTLGQITHC